MSDLYNVEFRKVVREELQNLSKEMHQQNVRLSILERSNNEQNEKLDEISNSVDITNNLIERAKGARWMLVLIATGLGGLGGWLSKFLH
jgi:hypothetical protein